MKAVVIGGTGLVGTHLISLLLREPKVTEILSVGRRSLGIKNAKLQEIKVQDLSELPKLAKQLQGDLYFCCLGTTIKQAKTQEQFRKVDYQAVLDFARIAKSCEARSLAVVSAAGSNPESKIFYNKVKGEMERDLKKLKLHQLVILKPGLLMGNRQESRPAEKLAMKLTGILENFVPSDIMNKFATSAEAVARKMIQESFASKYSQSILGPAEISS